MDGQEKVEGLETPKETTLDPVKREGVEKENLVKKFPKKDMKKNVYLVVAAFVVVLAGIGTGWMLSGSSSAQSSTPSPTTSSETKSSKDEAGIANEDAFPDTAEGIMTEGGKDGEGTHHLDRGLGPEKDVYLTSTVINLDDFVGKKVQIWGETISAQKAGWFMDVGRVKVVD